MNVTKLFVWFTATFCLLPFCCKAQTYEQLWRDVDGYVRMDLPASVVSTADKIYDKGQTERNIPQMMKAFIVRAEYRGNIAPDSLGIEKDRLKRWAETETDPLGRAVLNCIVGDMILNSPRHDVDEAVRYFERSLANKRMLVKASAKDYYPMTNSGWISKKYFGDSMFDLLARQAIRSLSSASRLDSMPEQEAAFSFYDDLIAYYESVDNRAAAFLCKESKLVFRYENMGIFKKYQSPVDEKVSELLSLASQYKELPVCADAYLKAASYCLNAGKKVKAVEVAQQGLREYPKGEWTADLRKVMDNVKHAEITVSIPFIYPERETEVKVSFANVTDVTLELYRLNLSPASKALLENNWSSLLKKYGSKVASRKYRLAPSADYSRRDTTLRYTLPQAGIYVLKQIAHGVRKTTFVDGYVLYVSPYQCVTVPVADVKREVIIIDRLTGRPVPGAELVEYDSENLNQKNVYKADDKGSVLLALSRKNRRSEFNARTPGNDFMALSALGGSFYLYGANQQEGWDNKAKLFTDRSIYRPGQMVHVSGLLFAQRGDSVQVRTDKPVELKLYKGTQTVASLKATSDSFGVFSGDFALPQSLLPGRYVISGEETSAFIDVEEYKRPTFDVKFTPYTATYTLGDSVSLQGEAKAFSGAPVRNAKVKYCFVRSCRWWYRWNKQNEVTLAEGELLTDSEGRFTVGVTLKAPDDIDCGDSYSPCFYDYQLTADVTGGAGETQGCTLSLPVSRQSLYLSIRNLNDIVMREKQPSVQFCAQNVNRESVKAAIEYRVYRFEAGKDGDKGELKCKGTTESQRSFVPADVWALPSGKYVIELSANDDKGRSCVAKKTFTLFSKDDRRVPDESVAWFYQNGNKFDEKNPPAFYVGTNERDVYLLVDIYGNKQRIESQRIKLDNELRAFSYPYKSEYGDGVLINVAFVRNGVLHNRSFSIVRPEPDKRLNLTWETFRDKLRPGDKEEWRMHITDRTGSPVQANLMAVLYDASLDKLHAHNWNFGLAFPRPLPSVRSSLMWNAQSLYLSAADSYVNVKNGLNLINYSSSYSSWNPGKVDYTSLFLFGGVARGFYELENMKESTVMAYGVNKRGRAIEMKFVSAEDSMYDKESQDAGANEEVAVETSMAAEEELQEPVTVRENFAETAFFYPQLRTDSLGNVTVAFTVPESLTEWKFMGFAHTPYLYNGMLTDKTVVQKQFMVQPNMPRFVRRGDKATIAASLVNMAAQTVSGVARIELSDPVSESVVYRASQKFSVAEGESGVVSFGFEVPQKYDVLVCTVTASAGEFSDGERHYLPVLTDKQWVTETVAVQVDGDDGKTISTSNLFNGSSKTATDCRLTVEMTANPDWYAVQALPVAGNPQNEDALSWATAYYANALAGVIVGANPRIKKVFEAWLANGGDKQTLLSNLERNADLKNILLKETPWITEAVDETEQKRRIALLFDLNTMRSRQQAAVQKLASLQNANGAWSWYKGMPGSRYVTTQIVEEFARLKVMGVTLKGTMAASYAKAVKYLASCAKKDYEEMKRMEKKTGHAVNLLNEQTIHYLYICSLDKVAMKGADKAVNDYFITKLENRSAGYTIYGKALVAIVMQGAGRTKQAAELVQSIKEYSVYTSEMGRYFDTKKALYSWRNYKIPTEVAAMEAVYRVSPDVKMLNEMKQWLLKQKQVQMWESSVATADAVYAFLCMNGNKLNSTGKMTATVGRAVFDTPDDALGYTRKTLTGAEAKVASLRMEKKGEGLGWGAVYAQYHEDLSRLSEYKGNGVTIVRDYLLNGKSVRSGQALHIGDKLTVRLTVKADRDMDFIQIKDSRAACMEPTDQLSGYSWNGKIGFYRASYDASTCFFIDRMPKGTHQIEYTVNVDRAGTYQSGIATVQSAYSPEFGGHSAGFTVVVEK